MSSFSVSEKAFIPYFTPGYDVSRRVHFKWSRNRKAIRPYFPQASRTLREPSGSLWRRLPRINVISRSRMTRMNANHSR
jgi:hypothetical protein